MSAQKTSPSHPDTLLAYNPDYCRREKLIRMCTGCGSEPLSYHQGVVEIEIRLTDRILQSPKAENLIQSIADIWIKAVPEAKLYKAHIYRSGRTRAGFLTSTAECQDENKETKKQQIKHLAGSITKMMTAERIDVKIGEREWPGHEQATQS